MPLILFFILFPLSSLAAKITVVTEHLAPFQMVGSSSITGLSTEVVEGVLDESGYEYNIEAYPWLLSYNRAKHEKNVCIYSLALIPERAPLFKWIGHITTSSISFYSLKKNSLSISELNEAKKYKIAVLKDDVTHHYLLSKGFIENENLYVMSNYDSLLLLLKTPSRQIDLIVLNDDLLHSRVNNKKEEKEFYNVFTLKELTLDFYFACSLQTEDHIVNKLINIMEIRESSGENSAIRNKWSKDMNNLID